MPIRDRLRGAVENRRRRFLTAAEADVALDPRPRMQARSVAAPLVRAPETGGLAGVARVLPVGPPTDQGNTPACGGFAVANAVLCRAELLGEPTDPAIASAYAMQVYRWCISGIDWSKYPGLSYLPAYAVDHGVAGGGVACATMDELADAIRAGYPVDISVRWWTSLSAPVDGNLTVRVDSNRESFHAICVVGFDPAHDFQHMPLAQRQRKVKQYRKKGKPIPPHLRPDPAPGFLLRNSWGVKWGKSGTAWIRATDLATLLARGAEQSGRAVNNAFYATDWRPVAVEVLYEGDAARHGR